MQNRCAQMKCTKSTAVLQCACMSGFTGDVHIASDGNHTVYM